MAVGENKIGRTERSVKEIKGTQRQQGQRGWSKPILIAGKEYLGLTEWRCRRKLSMGREPLIT